MSESVFESNKWYHVLWQVPCYTVFVKQIHIDGKLVKDIDRFPKDLQIREYPHAG